MTRAVLALSLLTAAVFAVVQLLFVHLIGDTHMLLHTTAHMLFEGGLYRRWISANPPMIYFIDTLPLLAIITLRLPEVTALNGYALLVCLLSIFCIRRILKEAGLEPDERRLWLAACILCLFVLPCAFYAFADREHFLFILALPWILQILLGRKPGILSACLAMLACCIKPYNLALFAFLPAFSGPQATLQQRFLNPAMLSAGLLATLYTAIVLLCFPDYLHISVPVAWTTYGTVAVKKSERLFIAASCTGFMLVAIAGLIPSPQRTSLLALTFACSLIYYLNAGWGYTHYLLAVPAMLLCPPLWLSHLAGRRALGACICLGLLAYSDWILEEKFDTRTLFPPPCKPGSQELDCALQAIPERDFFPFSANLWSCLVSALSGKPHSLSPFDDGPWPLAWIHKHPDDPQAEALVEAVFRIPFRLALAANPDIVLVVDESPGRSEDVFARVRQAPDIKKTLEAYHRVSGIDSCTATRKAACRFGFWSRINHIEH